MSSLVSTIHDAAVSPEAWPQALEALTDTSASKVTLPLVDEHLRRVRKMMGHDFWPYGLEANRATLKAFLQAHHQQGLSSRLVEPEELFHPSTLESYAI